MSEINNNNNNNNVLSTSVQNVINKQFFCTVFVGDHSHVSTFSKLYKLHAKETVVNT